MMFSSSSCSPRVCRRPRRSARRSASRWVARPVFWVVRIFGPVLIAIERLVQSILRLFGIRVGEDQEIIAARGDPRHGGPAAPRRQRGEARPRHAGRLARPAAISTVSDVMVHRTEMVTVNADDPPEEIVNAVLKSEYTRIPLWRDTPENIVGILHAKDLLRAIQNADGDLCQDRHHGDRAAAVVRARHPSAVGAAQGVPPPQDPLRAGGRRIRRGRRAWSRSRTSSRRSSATFPTSTTFRCRACGRSRTARSMSTARCRSAISTARWTGTCRTPRRPPIAGLVIHEARSIPDVGQSFTFHGFRFNVLRKQRNRITALRIMPLVRKPVPMARAS